VQDTSRWDAGVRLVGGVVVAFACLSWGFRNGGSGTGAAVVGVVLFFAGIGGAVVAVRSVIQLIQPEVLEQREHARWLATTAHLREPGGHEVVITSVGPRSVSVIKAIREVTGYDLLQAKAALDAGAIAVVRPVHS